MKAEFNELVETLKRWELHHEGDEVHMALESLEKKIDEVEKRMVIVRICGNDIHKLSQLFEDDTIMNTSFDIGVAMDLENNVPIEENWHGLFAPKKLINEPIAVGNIEYDFPEEVFTIGNADNTEIVADVYESVFDSLCKLGLIRCEGDNNFPFGKTSYIVHDNFSIPIVKINQIDLSKVPIIVKEFMSFES
jgi:hypothetical protein